ncbi:MULTISPECIES: hypothetical protein [unclassified Shewanella]|jgi:hypothetical protein|uniref:hypothetical protein n=1 Tax=unclassified Shewanella TaxID=196818 RepID=UPI000C7DC2BC|nr:MULTISPECIES: hypothetical protein [unclassified Shewanella]PKG56756.1 hypothetical protein CXF82_12975 [Shewanella sp. GutDb-MelDb]PKG75656.1 hypothetical protein CXF86_05985 [Shewanella sp. GutCb]
MKLRLVCFISFLSFGLTACTDSPEWTLLYYPSAAAKPSVEQSAEFISGYYASVDQCHAKGKGLLRLSDDKNADYVCGHLCVADGKTLVCQSQISSAE